MTDLFSQAQVPLIVDVIPMLEKIREGLIGARNDSLNDVPTVIRVACQAAILLVDKYSTFTADCPVYPIAMGASFIFSIYIVTDFLDSSPMPRSKAEVV